MRWGHYSDGGRCWWDDAFRRWFPLTDQQDTLEVELEDAASTSMVASLLETFPAPRAFLVNLPSQNQWAEGSYSPRAGAWSARRLTRGPSSTPAPALT